jgi:endonuclease/exonuclease/phosphatase family metal-dependent hydrolase
MVLRLASYNVHRAIGRDRRCEPQRILDVIREIDPDVVALQEVSTRRCRADLPVAHAGPRPRSALDAPRLNPARAQGPQ